MAFDAYTAVSLIEQYGEYLETLVSLEPALASELDVFPRGSRPLRFDMCDCQNMLKCPNGTSSPPG